MKVPDFYDQAPRITLRDPLAALLGAAEDGLIDYGYADAVKLAGHSCPTVAGAFLMVARGLAALYPDETPVRGDVKVELQAELEDGVAGVIGAVAGLLTGAAGAGGFKGLAGRFARHGLLHYGAPIDGDLRLTRLSNGRSVVLSYHPEVVPIGDTLRAAMARALQPGADAAALAAFADGWQARVRAILVDRADDARLVSCVSA